MRSGNKLDAEMVAKWSRLSSLEDRTKITLKEYKYLYSELLDKENIRKAFMNMRKHRTNRPEIVEIYADLDNKIDDMRNMILNTKPCEVEHPELAYVPEHHEVMIIHEHGKERKIYEPTIKELWLDHLIILVFGPIVIKQSYIYSCGSFPKRGAHYGMKRIRKIIKEGKHIKYNTKLDIRHFYNNIRLGVLLSELRKVIKDEWFIYIIYLRLKEFKKGIPLGFYISQWLANFLLTPLDHYIANIHGIYGLVRYMDDIDYWSDNKKIAEKTMIGIMIFIGRRYRLKLKHNYQTFLFDYTKKNGKETGRSLDFMGFLFYRNKVIVRKSILLNVTRTARRLYRQKQRTGKYYFRDVKRMPSLLGWLKWTDTYNCYFFKVKPYISVRKMLKIISKTERRKHDRLEGRTLNVRAIGA